MATPAIVSEVATRAARGDAVCVPDTTPVCDRVAVLDRLATDGAADPAVRKLAAEVYARAQALGARLHVESSGDPKMRKLIAAQQWFARLLALEALRCVQSVPYVADASRKDCYQAAGRTAVRGGECKALTVLLVALCRALRLQAEPVWVTQTGQMLNHVTARIRCDHAWMWAEPSVRGAMLGESPYEAVARTGAHDVIGASRESAPYDAQAQQLGVGRTPQGVAAAQALPGSNILGYNGGQSGWGGGTSMWLGSWGSGRAGSGCGAGCRSYPFGWWGWKGLWNGWPPSWWSQYYPYLYQPRGQVVAYPYTYGFYSFPFYALSAGGQEPVGAVKGYGGVL